MFLVPDAFAQYVISDPAFSVNSQLKILREFPIRSFPVTG